MSKLYILDDSHSAQRISSTDPAEFKRLVREWCVAADDDGEGYSLSDHDVATIDTLVDLNECGEVYLDGPEWGGPRLTVAEVAEARASVQPAA